MDEDIVDIIESLQTKEIDGVIFLIEDKSEKEIQNIKSQIQEQAHRLLFQQAVSQMKEKKEKQKYEEEIRIINRAKENQSDSDESVMGIMMKEKKKVEKIQDKFGYPFFSIVKFLMISYGDPQPQEKTVKMMHSQIQTLFSKIFYDGFKKKLNNPETKKYLQKIFVQQIQNYEQFLKLYKNATKGTKKNSDSDDDFPDDSDDQFEVDHCASLTEEEKRYFVNLTSKMSIEEYERYTEYRTYNFIHSKKNLESLTKFKKFIDPHEVMMEKNTKTLQLISFICCRFVRKIIFQIIRQQSPEQKLILIDNSIDSTSVTKVGNQLIDHFTQKLKTAFQSKEEQEDKYHQKAKQIFIQEFHDQKYREFLPRRVIKNAQKQGEEQLPHTIWAQNKHYQKMWIERMNAEEEVEKIFSELENGNQDPSCEYTKFILKNYEFYQKNGKGVLWRKYFTNQPLQLLPLEKPRKKIKLESLNS